MNVDVAVEAVAVVGFESFEPKDARDDGVAARGIGRKDFASRNAGFEDSSRREAIADFFPDAQSASWRGITARFVAEPKFGGRNRVLCNRLFVTGYN